MLLQNFTTYTEVDNVNDRIQVAANHIDHENHQDEETYVHSGALFGVDHFGDFEHLIDARHVSGDWQIYCWSLANVIGDLSAIYGASEEVLQVRFYAPSNKIYLTEYSGSTEYNDLSSFSFSDNVWYYFTIEKSGTTLTCKIYDAATRLGGDLLDTLTLTLQSDYKFRYLYPAQCYVVAGAAASIGDIDNLAIQEEWMGTINGVVNPAKINGISVADIAKVNGVVSS